MRPAVLLFVKYPEPGKVKTRLAATLGADRAATVYRRLVIAVCAALPAHAKVIVMFDPADQAHAIEEWLRPLLLDATMRPQASGDLGVRMHEAFAGAFALGFDKVAAIGSDCLELKPELFEQTWRALETNDCVIGPTLDGGYYLLALRQPAPQLFSGIEWSSDAVLAQTLDRASAAGFRVHILPKLHDVDTEDDWWRAERRLRS